MALELYDARSVNPLVNAGAIAAVSLVDADSEADRWDQIHGNLNDYAGRELTVLEEVYTSEYEESWSNRAIANLLFNYGRLYSEPEQTLRVYTRQCSTGINTRDLGMMGATLANEGVNPATGKRVLDAAHVPELLAIMATAGYDESGEWMYSAGLPAKTGVGGGIVAVVPGKFAIATFSLPLNEAGNSIRGMRAIRYIAGELGVGLYAQCRRIGGAASPLARRGDSGRPSPANLTHGLQPPRVSWIMMTLLTSMKKAPTKGTTMKAWWQGP